MTDNANSNTGMIRLGGLWLNTSRGGEKYFSGNLGSGRVLVFRNQHKRTDKDPDYVLYIAPKQEGQPAQPDEPAAPPMRDAGDIPF